MRFTRTRLLAAAATLLLVGAQPQRADLVLRGGAIYTLDASRSWAEAIAVRQGRIVFVGTGVGAEPWIGPETRVLELQGQMVLPSFQDSHVHPVSGGVELGQCDLNGLATQKEVLDAIKKCAAETPQGGWVVGGGWHLPLFPQASPTRELLDSVVGDRPAYLTAMDGHSAWVSSRALAIAGIDRTTADPPDGRIERNAAGEPSGTLRESAMDLVSRHVPPPTPVEHAAGLERALAMANRFGITALHEARADSPEILDAYADLDRRGRLTARVVVSLKVFPEKGPEQVDDLIGKRKRYRGRRLRATAAKIFADGVIESGTAALLSEYLDRPGERGRLNFEPEEKLNRIVSRLDEEGFQIHIHAIGDRAIRTSLDALEAARKANRRADARHHIAHLELIDPVDIPRFRDLGIIANFQPLWAYADSYITDLTEPKLGPERSRWLYPIGSVARSGTVIVGGSDWSVSSMNPLEAIQVALTRRGPDAPRGEPWIPEERVDLATLLAAYTINGAYLSHEEKERGSLEPGKSADLVVLDRNLFALPPEEIHGARVLLTLLEGKEVYRDPGFSR
jgi:predicted amidohydrolase YtcJ